MQDIDKSTRTYTSNNAGSIFKKSTPSKDTSPTQNKRVFKEHKKGPPREAMEDNTKGLPLGGVVFEGDIYNDELHVALL